MVETAYSVCWSAVPPLAAVFLLIDKSVNVLYSVD
jgi:hypothetical protein